MVSLSANRLWSTAKRSSRTSPRSLQRTLMRPPVDDRRAKAGLTEPGQVAGRPLPGRQLPQERLLERQFRGINRAAQQLPGPTPMGGSTTGRAAMGPVIVRGEYNHEPVTAIYPPAGGHLTFDGGHFACRWRCVQAVARVGITSGGLSD